MIQFDEVTHRYTKNGIVIPSVTQILSSAGLIDDDWYTEESRQRGKAVHIACHYFDENDLDWNSVSPQYLPYVQAHQKFCKDTSIQWTLIEHRIYNPVYNYCGILDREAILNGEPAIIDLKTGLVNKWVALQTAAYEAGLPPLVNKSRKRFALQLKSDGTYKLHPFIDRTDIRVFTAAAAVVNWKLKHGQIL